MKEEDVLLTHLNEKILEISKSILYLLAAPEKERGKYLDYLACNFHKMDATLDIIEDRWVAVDMVSSSLLSTALASSEENKIKELLENVR